MPDPSTRRAALAFLLSMVAAAGAVVAIGWFTDLRDAMHGALIAVATFALLPFAIIAIGVFLALVLLALTLVLALFTDGGGDVGGGTEVAEPFVEGGLRIMGPYYRWLARQRHPTFWGVPAGVVLGALVLWSMIATVVLPAEARTADILVKQQRDIDAHYARHKRYPRPTPDGHLAHSDLGRITPGVVTDAAGRPLLYDVDGRWRMASYHLRAVGPDGRPGTADDLCISGATRLSRLKDTAGGLKDGRVTLRSRLSDVRDLRCNHPPDRAK